MPVVPALGKVREEDGKFRHSLGYTVRLPHTHTAGSQLWENTDHTITEGMKQPPPASS